MQEWYKVYMRNDDFYWQKRAEKRRKRSRFFRDLLNDTKQMVALLAQLRYGIDMGNSEKQAGANQHHDPETPQTK